MIRVAGLLGVMSSYNDYDGFPIQSSYYWLTTRLRGEFGFRGYVVSDSDAVEYLFSKHGTAADMKESVLQSVLAGLNIRCTFRSPDSYVLPLRELIAEGAIPMSTIDDRVRDILRVKFLVGLFDHPYQIDLKETDKEVNCAENQLVALQASKESLVLLKNQDAVLPLDVNKISKIAVCGPNADEEAYALTHYGPLAVEVTTVLEGIRNKVKPGTNVLFTKGCDLVDANWPESELIRYPLTAEEQSEIDKAVENAKKSDVTVVVLGGSDRTCGENKSRSSLDLPGRQLDLLQAVVATGKPVVLVLINGRPLSINWADKYVPAILEAWYPGSQGGTAIPDAMFGDYNPAGRLPITFYKNTAQLPDFEDYSMKGRTYRYMQEEPLFPFGHGLSYTTFAYGKASLDKKARAGKENRLTILLTNSGIRDGEEVIQVYVRNLQDPDGPEKSLRAFKRVSLRAGETRKITVDLRPSTIDFYDPDNGTVWSKPGKYEILYGGTSDDKELKKLSVTLK